MNEQKAPQSQPQHWGLQKMIQALKDAWATEEQIINAVQSFYPTTCKINWIADEFNNLILNETTKPRIQN